jgi:hypothetical protein
MIEDKWFVSCNDNQNIIQINIIVISLYWGNYHSFPPLYLEDQLNNVNSCRSIGTEYSLA